MHDLLLRGGTVFDGLGSPGATADVAVDGDRVTAVGRDLGPARRVLDVDGLVVAPGFIDPHAHSDVVALMDEAQPFKLLQGVTTEIVGNCGFSFAPMSEESAAEAEQSFGDLLGGTEIVPGSFGELLGRIETAGPTNHLAFLVGHNTLRLTANGVGRELGPGALEAMQRMAAEAFAAGAVGLSSGLIYIPGAYSATDELVAVATVAHRWQRPYTTHMRDEGSRLETALDEAIEIGRRARVRVQVSHCKAAGRDNHGKSKVLLERLHEARRSGIDVRGDQYPYLAGSTTLATLLPSAAHEHGVDALRKRLNDPEERSRLRTIAYEETGESIAGLWRAATPEDVLVTTHRDHAVVGRTLAAIAARRDPWEVACELILADPAAGMVISDMDEGDVQTIMRDPLIAVGSDNGIPVGLQHPRTWGCFPRFLGRYVRELGVVPPAEGIRKMTSASADQFGLAGRGWLGSGSVADICVFDPHTVDHAGTYLEPDVPPAGIRAVVLAGTVVVENGEFTGGRHGRVLRAGDLEAGTNSRPDFFARHDAGPGPG
jgi:N-acyl-D-amino-acid deacylase